jgi:predicted RecA/RadA family phage recombinase
MNTEAENYYPGDNIDYTPETAKTAGQIVQVAGRAAMVCTDLAAGQKGAAQVKGIIKVAADTSTGIEGDEIWWDENGDPYDGTAGTGAATTNRYKGNFLLGSLTEDKGATDEYAVVDLNVTVPDMVNHDIIFGKLLSGGRHQDIHEASDTQNYPIGTMKQLANGEPWHYAKAGGTINTDLGVWSYNSQHVKFTTVAGSVAAGVTQFKIDIAGTDGVAGNGAIAANELAGGYIVIFPHSSNTFVRQIVANTVTTGAGEMTITVNKPIPVALVVDVSHVEAMASPFLDVRTGNNGGRRPVLGKADVAATVGQYLWIQGPKLNVTWLAPQGEVGVGDHDNQIVFRHDGSVDEHDYSDAYTNKQQHAGTVLSRYADNTQGAPFISLQN